MSGGAGGWGVPGIGTPRVTTEREIFWGADQARNAVLWKSGAISGASRDAGNSPVTVLRPGLIFGTVDSTGEYEEWDADASDGTQDITGILDAEIRAQDYDATNQDRVFRVVVARAPLKSRMLLIQGLAFLGHADEFLARRQLHAAFHVLDDDPMGFLAAQGARIARVTGTTDTLTAAENGKTLIYSNAASVTVTLPAIKAGLSFDLIREGDEELVVVSTEGDNVIVGNDLSADGITFTTASEHMGAQVHVESIYVNTTLKWRITLPHVPFGTGVNTVTYGIQS